jgi:hypothetical protein
MKSLSGKAAVLAGAIGSLGRSQAEALAMADAAVVL